MVPRALWKGFLKLSLVSCPVALYPAVAASERISFRQVNKQTGNRLRQQLVDVVTGEPVQAHNKGRGYEVGENQFLLVRDDELEAAEQEGRRRPYSSVPARSAVQHAEQPGAANLEPPKRLFTSAPMKSAPRREEEPLARLLNLKQDRIRCQRVRPRPLPRRPQSKIIARSRSTASFRVRRSTHDISIHLTTSFRAMRLEKRHLQLSGMRCVPRMSWAWVVLSSRDGRGRSLSNRWAMGFGGLRLRYSHEVRDEASYFAEIPKSETT